MLMPFVAKPPERLVERRRQVADAEDEARHRRAVAGRDPLRGSLDENDEAGGVVGLVLHVLGQDLEAVDLRRQPGRQRRAGRILPLGHLAGRARRVARHMGLEAELADDLAALAERVDVAVHAPDGAEIGLRQAP